VHREIISSVVFIVLCARWHCSTHSCQIGDGPSTQASDASVWVVDLQLAGTWALESFLLVH